MLSKISPKTSVKTFIGLHTLNVKITYEKKEKEEEEERQHDFTLRFE